MEMKWKLTVPLDKCNCSCFFIWLLSNICGHFFECGNATRESTTDLIMGLCRSLEINMLFRKGKEGSNGFYTCRCFLFLSLPNNTPNANSSKCLLLNQVQRPKDRGGVVISVFGGDCARVDNHKTFSLQIQTLCETFRLIKDVIVL